MKYQPRTITGRYTSRKEAERQQILKAQQVLSGLMIVPMLYGSLLGILNSSINTPSNYPHISPVPDNFFTQVNDYRIIGTLFAAEAASSVGQADEATSAASFKEITDAVTEFTLPHYTQEQKDNILIISAAAKRYGVSERLMLAIGRCESTFRSEAANPNSSARGLYQYIKDTWMRWVAKRGLDWTLEDRFDPYKNADMTAYILQDLRGLSNWTADPKSHACWEYALAE